MSMPSHACTSRCGVASLLAWHALLLLLISGLVLLVLLRVRCPCFAFWVGVAAGTLLLVGL